MKGKCKSFVVLAKIHSPFLLDLTGIWREQLCLRGIRAWVNSASSLVLVAARLGFGSSEALPLKGYGWVKDGGGGGGCCMEDNDGWCWKLAL